MDVKELKEWLSNKKDDAKVNVVAHNMEFAFSLCTGGGSDGGNDYESVDFYVDELCQNEQV